MGETGGSTKPADKPAPAQGTPAADPSKPQQGGVFVRAVNYGDPGNLDPIAKGDVSSRMITMQIFSYLVRCEPVEKKIVNDVAEDFSVSSDGLTYTFKQPLFLLDLSGAPLRHRRYGYPGTGAVQRLHGPGAGGMADDRPPGAG